MPGESYTDCPGRWSFFFAFLKSKFGKKYGQFFFLIFEAGGSFFDKYGQFLKKFNKYGQFLKNFEKICIFLMIIRGFFFLSFLDFFLEGCFFFKEKK